jgi:hypothetical protein
MLQLSWVGLLESLVLMLLLGLLVERALSLIFGSRAFAAKLDQIPILKDVLAALAALAICQPLDIDLFAALLENRTSSLAGILVSAVVVAGTSKLWVRLLADVLGVRSSAEISFKASEHLKQARSQTGDHDATAVISFRLTELDTYYAMNKRQAQASFQVSIIATFVGLGTILTGVLLFYFKDNPRLEVSGLTAVGGLLAEFIAATHLYLYKRGLEETRHYFDRLSRLQDTLLAIQLAERFGGQNPELFRVLVEGLVPRQPGDATSAPSKPNRSAAA